MAATWFDAVTLYVEVAWDDSPSVAIASRSYTDHAQRVLSFTTDRGRRTEFSPYAPGTATVTVYDPERVFDSANSAGPHYGKIQPMRPIRLRAAIGVTTATLFSGFLTAVILGYDEDGKVPTATLTCVDGFQVMDADCPGSAYAAAVLASSPDHYWPMQESDGVQLWPLAGDAILLDRPTSVGYFDANTTTTLPLGEPVMMSSGTGDIYPSPDTAGDPWPNTTAISAWIYDPGDDLLGSPYAIILPTPTTFITLSVYRDQINVRYSDATANKRSVATTGDFTVVACPDLAGTHAHVAVTFSSTGINVYLDGLLHATIATEAGTYTFGSDLSSIGIFGADPDTPPEASISHAAIWNTSTPTAADILAHYEAGTVAHGHPMGERTGTRIDRILTAIGWPSADRDIATGSTVCGQWLPAGGAALDACREAETTEQGLFFISADGKATFRDRPWIRGNTKAVTSQATFGDQAGEIRYTDDIQPTTDIDYVRNVITTTYPGGSVTVKDATSVTSYGNQRDSVNAQLLPASDGWLARQLANYRLRERKDARQRVDRIVVKVRRDTANVLPTLLGLDLGHRVTVNRRPPGGTGSMSLALAVQGIKHEVDKSAGGWQVELYLAPAPKSATEAGYMITGTSLVGDTTTSY